MAVKPFLLTLEQFLKLGQNVSTSQLEALVTLCKWLTKVAQESGASGRLRAVGIPVDAPYDLPQAKPSR